MGPGRSVSRRFREPPSHEPQQRNVCERVNILARGRNMGISIWWVARSRDAVCCGAWRHHDDCKIPLYPGDDRVRADSEQWRRPVVAASGRAVDVRLA